MASNERLTRKKSGLSDHPKTEKALRPILGALPALLLALGQGGMTPLWVLFAYVAVQALENNVITPFILARRMSLHPLAVIFSISG
jgi:predicted PurR-regulated permease PerM